MIFLRRDTEQHERVPKHAMGGTKIQQYRARVRRQRSKLRAASTSENAGDLQKVANSKLYNSSDSCSPQGHPSRASPNLLLKTHTIARGGGAEACRFIHRRCWVRSPPTCSGSGIKGCWCWVWPTFAGAPPPAKTPSRNTVGGTSIVVFSNLQQKRTGEKTSNSKQVLCSWEAGGHGWGSRPARPLRPAGPRPIQTRDKGKRETKAPELSSLAPRGPTR